MAQTVEELAYDLSLAAVARQEARAGELRARTGTLLAAAAITASFFGARTVGTDELDAAGVLALAAYLWTVGAGLVVLLPRRLVLEFHGTALLEYGADIAEAHEIAAAWLDRFHARNRDAILVLEHSYERAVVGLAEILLWTVSVGGILG
jgi:xanthine/CO dehydrogenase XdhC/CoxF family maturation factor